MKKFVIIVRSTLVVTPIMFVASALFINHPDFSGEWKLDESKSELGEFGRQFAIPRVKIVQYKDSITFTKTHPNGEAIETVSYDGKERVLPMAFGRGTKKLSAKWSQDGQSLIISFVIRPESGQEITITHTYSLKEDKLYIDAFYSSPQQGDLKIKAVYDKQ